MKGDSRMAKRKTKTQLAEERAVRIVKEEKAERSLRLEADKIRLAEEAAAAAETIRQRDARVEKVRLALRKRTRESLLEQGERNRLRAVERRANRSLRSGDKGHERKRNPVKVAAEARS